MWDFCFISKSVDCREANAFLGCMNLKMRVKSFFEKTKNNLHILFHNEEFVVMLAYLADVFGHINDMNLYLQGRDVTVSDVKDKLAGITVRMAVWQARFKVGSYCICFFSCVFFILPNILQVRWPCHYRHI